MWYTREFNVNINDMYPACSLASDRFRNYRSKIALSKTVLLTILRTIDSIFERCLYFRREGYDSSTSGTFWSQSIRMERRMSTKGPRRWKDERLAFDDRFQYHEWTFKQACISCCSVHSPAPLQHHSYRLPFSCSLSSLHWLGSDVFPPDPRSVFPRAPYCARNCNAKLCAILNILINRVTPCQHGVKINSIFSAMSDRVMCCVSCKSTGFCDYSWRFRVRE